MNQTMHYECPGAFCSFISVFPKSGDRTGNDCLDAVHDKFDLSPGVVSNNNLHSVKPVLRGHHWDKEKALL